MDLSSAEEDSDDAAADDSDDEDEQARSRRKASTTAEGEASAGRNSRSMVVPEGANHAARLPSPTEENCPDCCGAQGGRWSLR